MAPVVLETTGIKPEVNYDDLAGVLQAVVQQKGFVDPTALARCTDRLDAQVKRLAITGPTSTAELFPTAAEELAYWYNARAAWTMKLVLLADRPRTLQPAALETRPIPLDGRMMTLKKIDAILLAQNNWLAVVAAPGIRLQRAALPQKPFTGADVHRRILSRVNEFVDDEKRFVIDIENKRILIPPVLWRLRKRLIGDYNRTYGTKGATLATALGPYLSGSARRRLEDAIGYACFPAPFKPTLAVAEVD